MIPADSKVTVAGYSLTVWHGVDGREAFPDELSAEVREALALALAPSLAAIRAERDNLAGTVELCCLPVEGRGEPVRPGAGRGGCADGVEAAARGAVRREEPAMSDIRIDPVNRAAFVSYAPHDAFPIKVRGLRDIGLSVSAARILISDLTQAVARSFEDDEARGRPR